MSNLIHVNGLDIKVDAVYKVIGKPDKSAPSGFVKEGVTKLPSEGIGNSIPCRYVIKNKSKGTGVYDTGFYESSPCYNGLSKDERREKVEYLRKTILEPYEQQYGVSLEHTNEDFWDEFSVDLWDGRFFVTEKVEDLLGLYIAMMSYELTPKEKIGNPKYRESQYCVEDKEKVRSNRQERSINIMDAIGTFTTLYDTDKSRLFDILRYSKMVGIFDDINKETLKASFYDWLNRDSENIERFNQSYNLAKGDGIDELKIYSIIHKLYLKRHIKRDNGMYLFNGEEIGPDLKTAANRINKDQVLEHIKIQLLELDNDD